MDKETLSHYGWIVVLVMILAVLLAFATPFGTFLADGFKATYAGFDMVGTSAMDIVKDVTGGCSHEYDEHVCTKCGDIEDHECIYDRENNCTICHLNKPIAFEITHENYYMAGITREGNVVIPDEFIYEGKRYQVTGIGKIAFDNCPELISVYIPDTVTYIEYPRSSSEHWGGAFSNCPKLEYVRMSPNIKGTLRGTFYQCKSLKSIEIPDGVTTMYWYTFSGCRSLTEIKISENSKLASMSSDPVSGTSLTTIILPNTITNLGSYSLTNSKFENIQYRGTMDQWARISKGSPYTYKHIQVICSDDVTCTLPTGNDEATCTQRAICSTCNSEYGLLKPHIGGEATCQNKAICEECHQEYGEIVACAGGTATCYQKATCKWCHKEYGNLTSHDIKNGECTMCYTKITIVETKHNSYPNSQNYVVLGTWNYIDAKSVNITITYQTESASWDWCSITSGTDYIANSSYVDTRQYLNINGQIVNTTGSNSNIKFGGKTQITTTFENVNMLTGSIIFRSDSSVNGYYGVTVIVTPNY